jgi:polysaccharide transporter, PST family
MDSPSTLQKFIAHPLARNTLSLYGISLVSYLVPLVLIPFLARVLGPTALGLVVLAQSFGIWLSLILEYGFSFSATRSVAVACAEKASADEIAASVLGSKAVLLAVSLLVTALCLWAIPYFRSSPRYFLLAWVGAAAQGFFPLWYFQGTQNLVHPSLLTLGVRLAATLATLLVVRTPDDGWMVLALQAGAGVLLLVVGNFWLYREVSLVRPRWAAVKAMLRQGATIFLFTAASSVYSLANLFLLSALVTPLALGYYAGADRLHKAVYGLFGPLGQAFFPHITHRLASDPNRARREARLGLLLMTSLGVLLGVMLAVGASVWVRWLLGPGYESAVPLIQILAIQLPLTGISRMLGVQWMLPCGLDKPFARIVLLAGVINIGLILTLVPVLGLAGMAWALVITEAYVTGSLAWGLHRSANSFWASPLPAGPPKHPLATD